MKARPFRSTLAIVLSFGCAIWDFPSAAAQSATAVETTPPTIAPYVFWAGKEGAECMANVLRAKTPSSNAAVGTFQDFDILYPTVEYEVGGDRVRYFVVSAPEWVVRSGIVFPAQNLDLYYYFFFTRSVAPLPSDVLVKWATGCGAFRNNYLGWIGLGPGPGHGNLGPYDFAIRGQFVLEELLPLLKPAPLTPVDIR